MLNHRIFSLAFILCFLSCEKELEIDLPNEEPLITINSLFHPAENFSAEITESMSPFQQNAIKEISTAEVKLYEDNTFLENLIYFKGPEDYLGKFYASQAPEVGKSYNLEVSYNGQTASTTAGLCPPNTPISEFSSNWVSWGDSTNIIRYFFDFTIDDPELNSFYYFKLYFPVYAYNEASASYEFYKRQYLEIATNDLPEHEIYFNNGLLFNDEAFNGYTKRITGTGTTFTLPETLSGADEDLDLIINKSTLYIEFRSVSSEAYKFHSSLAKRIAAANDAYSEPSIIYSNIINGLGIFAGENMTETETIIIY